MLPYGSPRGSSASGLEMGTYSSDSPPQHRLPSTTSLNPLVDRPAARSVTVTHDQLSPYSKETATRNGSTAEDTGLPSGGEWRRVLTRMKWWRVLLVLAVVAYTIAALVHDFKRAQNLLWTELALAGAFTALQVYEYKQAECDAGVERMAAPCRELLARPAAKYSLFGLLAAGMLAVSIVFSYEEPERFASAGGLVGFIALGYGCSWHRHAVQWRPVVWGFSLQFVLALFILRTHAGFVTFEWLGIQVTHLLNYTTHGSSFVFGYLVTGDASGSLLPVFAFSVLPTVIFFSALVSILFHLGVLQVFIRVIAFTLAQAMGTSASESVNAAGNIFVGQTEAPLLIAPFLPDMTKSEMHAVMTGGFATIAGGVLAIYIQFGISATHLIAASIMSAPAALAVSKLVYPELDHSPTAAGKPFQIARGQENNVIEAAASGASIAVVLAGNIAGMLIAFLALIAMLDQWLGYFGGLVGWEAASFSELCGYVFCPVAIMMGVAPDECVDVGQLLGLKLFVNEFVAYDRLREYQEAGTMSTRAITISTYALCGFSNFGSIGVQLGGLGPLAPERKKDLAQVVLSAMVCGNVACFMTACIAGLLHK